MVIAKYDSQGNLIWVKQAGGDGDDVNYAIAVDTVAKVSVTGTFTGSATFGNFVVRDSNQKAAFFVAQLGAVRK
jgi:arginine repressor